MSATGIIDVLKNGWMKVHNGIVFCKVSANSITVQRIVDNKITLSIQCPHGHTVTFDLPPEEAKHLADLLMP